VWFSCYFCLWKFVWFCFLRKSMWWHDKNHTDLSSLIIWLIGSGESVWFAFSENLCDGMSKITQIYSLLVCISMQNLNLMLFGSSASMCIVIFLWYFSSIYFSFYMSDLVIKPGLRFLWFDYFSLQLASSIVLCSVCHVVVTGLV
jgi:hypothetical protein